MKRIKRTQSAASDVCQLECRSRTFAQSLSDAAGIDPPIHLKSIGGKPRVETVAHLAVFRAAVGGADRAELGNVEICVAAEQGIVGPGDVVETLMTHHLPLRAFEREADAAVAVVGMNAEHVRAMFGTRTVGSFFETGEAEDEADDLFFNERTQHQPAVVDSSDEHVQGGRHPFRSRARLRAGSARRGAFLRGFR
jgi:hypothetical protein